LSQRSDKNAKVETEMLSHGMEFDLHSNEGMRAASFEILTACRTLNVYLAEDDSEARKQIGMTIVQMKDSTCKEIIDAIVKSKGVKKSAAAEKQTEDFMSSACVHPQHGPLFLALSELSKIYFKAGNTNAGNTYRKVSVAVRDCPFVLTADTAKHVHKKGHELRLENVGKGSGDKIVEFITTGTMAKLEEKRAGM